MSTHSWSLQASSILSIRCLTTKKQKNSPKEYTHSSSRLNGRPSCEGDRFLFKKINLLPGNVWISLRSPVLTIGKHTAKGPKILRALRQGRVGAGFLKKLRFSFLT